MGYIVVTTFVMASDLASNLALLPFIGQHRLNLSLSLMIIDLRKVFSHHCCHLDLIAFKLSFLQHQPIFSSLFSDFTGYSFSHIFQVPYIFWEVVNQAQTQKSLHYFG
jgi:hypothetical protein